MKREGKVKAIVFDIGGVLALGDYASKPIRGHRELGVHDYMLKKLKIPLDQYFDALDTAYAYSIEGHVSEKRAIDTIARNLKITPKKLEKLFVKAYRKNFKQNKQLYKLAFKLKKQGYKIAILSDQWWLSKRALVLPKYMKKFDKVVISCDVGMRKPNPKIYRLILKKLRLLPSNCVFIDNQVWNTKPAKKLGLKTILFKDNKQLFKSRLWRELVRTDVHSKQLNKLGVKI